MPRPISSSRDVAATAPNLVDRDPARPGPVSLRTLLRALAVVVSLGVLPPMADGQIDPNYGLHFSGPYLTESGGIAPVTVLFEVEPAGQEVSAISFGICHDPTLVAPLSAQPGGIFSTANNGAPADFVDLQTDPTLGVTVGVVICFTSCANLPSPQIELPIATIDYQSIGGAGSTAILSFCDTVAIGGNPVPTIVVTAGAGQRIPVTEVGTIEIFEIAFVRGDCDNDDQMTISDAIYLLGKLFGPIGDPVACEDACDTTDDSSVNIADAIRILQYLFGGGLAPPEPFPSCGADPTVDALDCAQPPTLCSP